MKRELRSITISTITIIAFVYAANGQDRGVLGEAERISGDRFAVSMHTPKGANVYAVAKPGARVLAAIDKGLADLFAVARRSGYRKRLNFADYSIYIGRPDRVRDSSGGYSPDIAVGAAQYRGSVFDQGGFVYAAGMVIANDPCSFLVADHEKDLDRLSNIVRYEGEHLVLYHNDRTRYAATADHSRGGSHPILQ